MLPELRKLIKENQKLLYTLSNFNNSAFSSWD